MSSKVSGKQSIVNKVYNHFIRDNNPPGVEKGAGGEVISGCKYLTADGNKCAIGCQLTPAQLEVAKGFNSIGVIWLVNVLSDAGLSTRSIDYISLQMDIQDAHDQSASSRNFHEAFATRLRDVCTLHNLEYPGDAKSPVNPS